MHEVGINKGGGADWFALWFWCIKRKCFFGCAIDGMHPIICRRLLPINLFVVGDASAKADASVRILLEISNNALGSIQVSLQGGNPVAAEGHDSMSNVKAAKGDCPLHGTEEAFILKSFL